MDKIRDITKGMDVFDGNVCQANFWKIKNKIIKKPADPPMAKRNKEGNLITSPLALKKLYLDTYVKRLSPALLERNFYDIFLLKNELWERRNEVMQVEKTLQWEMRDLEAALKRLKLKKSRDPHGLIGEIFKNGYSGQDLKTALLLLFNGMKDELFIPSFVMFANITSLWKRKGSKQDMENE